MKKKNQLFSQPVSEPILNNVLHAFNLHDFDDDTVFTKRNLELYGTLEKLLALKESLRGFYYHCKFTRFLTTNINTNRCIVILRQCLRSYKVSVVSRQKYLNHTKTVFYHLQRNVNQACKSIKVNHERRILVF